MKKVTIQDIAHELKLSRNTVAKALNNGAVAYETRREVVLKANEMGYAKLDPELLSHMTRRQQDSNKGIILVLFNRAESLFWNKILTGISDEVREYNYRMQLHIVDENDWNGVETLKIIEEDVKGIVFLCGFPLSFVKGIGKAKRPMTFFNAPVEAASFLEYGNVVSLEGKYSVCQLTQRVIDAGKKTFAFIGHASGSYNIQSRLDGMLQALGKNNIEFDSKMLITEWAKHGYYNYSVVEEVVQGMSYIPEVIVCANDDIAKYVASALMKKDMELAMRTTLIGFDNTIEEEFFKQDILTVHIRKEEVGRRLIKTTLDKINNPDLDNAIITVATYPVLK
ncbi:MAG TPA: LacI family DNA-binding transcriptional regulator [Lachnospiraceae bacterium]|nr:LacI family DNA-binding transcriptional regulator [Lachnospiraceae bacterium]